MNFDSLDEIVRDLSWLEFENIALIVVGSSLQWRNNYSAMASAFEICIDAHLFWKGVGKGFFIALAD